MKDKNKNRKGYKKTKVGWIPEKWNCSRLENAASVRTGPFGAQLHERDYVDDGTPIVTVEHLSELGIVHRNLPLVSDKDKKRLSRYILKMGDIVFSRVGSVDRNSLVSVREEGWLFSGRLLRVRPNCKYLFPLYVSSVFHRQTFKNHMRNIAVGGTMACLNTTLLSRVFTPLPPLPEQKAIASVLECWDKTIQKYEEKIEKKKNIKKGLMQKLLSGEQRLPGFDGEWEEVKTNDIMTVSYGKDWKAVAEENGPYPVYGTGGQIGTSSEYLFNSPAILLGRKGTIDSPRFLSEPFWAVDTTFAIHCDTGTNAEFIFSKFQTVPWRQYNEASGVPSLSRKTIESLHFMLPNESEQTAIASVLSSADSEIKALENKLTLIRNQKKYLLNNLVTGTIRLPEFCKEVG